jgi:Zn-dependent peptidase ImmA (M78 family)
MNPFDAFDERAVQRLAAQFAVSVQALTIRLTRLRLITAWQNVFTATRLFWIASADP